METGGRTELLCWKSGITATADPSNTFRESILVEVPSVGSKREGVPKSLTDKGFRKPLYS